MELTEYLMGCKEDLKTLGIHLQDLSLQSEEALKITSGKIQVYGKILFALQLLLLRIGSIFL
jgi:hypothetical protein